MLSSLLPILVLPALLSMASAAGVKCTVPFNKITATAWASRANPGWNLGNTLDALPTEGSWGNVANFSTFDDLRKGGFKGLRLPGMYSMHTFCAGLT